VVSDTGTEKASAAMCGERVTTMRLTLRWQMTKLYRTK